MPLKEISPDVWRKSRDEQQKELEAMYKNRAEDIKQKYAQNWSMAHIARHWGITKQRVEKILKGNE